MTVSALSSVKDAAGAVAKVLDRKGSCLLVALRRAGEMSVEATHIAAKTLAVSRFYINAHMTASGTAGIAAARALALPAATAAAIPGTTAAVDTADAAATDSTTPLEEVTFTPYNRSHGSQVDEDSFAFVVSRTCADDLAVRLPPPVGQPMSDQQQSPAPSAATVADAGNGHDRAAAVPVLKAGARTDVNKLSNAIIHNVLEHGHAALQLAGAAACHVAMKALVRARGRLIRKFNVGVTSSASFTNEDTSNSIGRSTVFLRLDVLRCAVQDAVSSVAGSEVASLADVQYA